jgi:hypothetical protein
MEKLSRRNFIQNAFGSIFAVSLVSSLCEAQALTGGVKTFADKWIVEMEQITAAMRNSKIRQSEWQRQIESLLAKVDLKDLLRAIDYDRLAKIAVFPEDHESAENVDFSQVAGLPAEPSFNPYFYAMKEGVAIVPHGHRNMSSMHMVLSGEARGWQFERVADEPEHLIIKPTSDEKLVPGDASTVSDDNDNIHWFKAARGPLFMFNIGVFGIKPKESFTGRDYIDPRGGEKLEGGLIRARRIEKEEAYKLYGKS